jgi:ATP-dependent helicase/nuclease subunit A
MNDNPSLAATDPQRDASVHASAGTGKTWLLVTRVLRLLLAGAPVDNILAITFTRKASAEMELRIMERLRELACADDGNCQGTCRKPAFSLTRIPCNGPHNSTRPC